MRSRSGSSSSRWRTIFRSGSSACRTIVFWGLDDADSWVPDAYPRFGDATLLDGELHAKPAYAAVREALLRG